MLLQESGLQVTRFSALVFLPPPLPSHFSRELSCRWHSVGGFPPQTVALGGGWTAVAQNALGGERRDPEVWHLGGVPWADSWWARRSFQAKLMVGRLSSGGREWRVPSQWEDKDHSVFKNSGVLRQLRHKLGRKCWLRTLAGCLARSQRRKGALCSAKESGWCPAAKKRSWIF